MDQMTIRVPGVEELIEKVESLQSEIKLMKQSLPVKLTVTISDIAQMEGISRSSLYGQERYLLPRFGESAYPDGVARWDMDEYLKWRAIAPKERKLMYLKHINNEHRMLGQKQKR